MITIRTRPINTRPASSMRAALNSKYCMRAQILARSSNGEFFAYQEGQHRVTPYSHKLHLPEEVKITKTANSKRWSTSSMEVEKAGDILEVRDGLGKIVDALVLKPKA